MNKNKGYKQGALPVRRCPGAAAHEARDQRLSSIRLMTTVADISRLAASGMTSERGDSMTSSVTIMLRLTGRQCMKAASLVSAILAASTVQSMSFESTFP